MEEEGNGVIDHSSVSSTKPPSILAEEEIMLMELGFETDAILLDDHNYFEVIERHSKQTSLTTL